MKRDLILFTLALCIISQLPAYAYLDPGTGSLIVQIILATCAGAAYWIKIQWHNIKEFFKRTCVKK